MKSHEWSAPVEVGRFTSLCCGAMGADLVILVMVRVL